MVIGNALADQVVSRIDPDEVVDLAIELSNIDSPPGDEWQVADAVGAWLDRNAFPYRKLALLPNRPNVAARLPGTGDGYSLIFNSHMDTSVGKDESLVFRDLDAAQYRKAWRDGDMLFGEGIINDKGPMAAWMIAVKAIRDSGVKLAGDIIMTMVSGEIGQEPVDEFEAPNYLSKDIGAHYLVTHGIVADFALVAETSNFCPAWIEAGKALVKISVYGGGSYYTPYVPRPTAYTESTNALVRAARLVERIEAWANEYSERHRYESPGGTCLPKVQIGAMRSGSPSRNTRTPEIAHLYLDVRLNPKQDVLLVQKELRGLLVELGLEGEVELYLYRRGYEGQGVEPLVDAIGQAHQSVFGKMPGAPPYQICSMWRDINVFNELGIPAVTFGPGIGQGGGNFQMAVKDLVTASRLYGMIALDICNRVKPTA